jgi:hypothetical protein
VNEDFVDLSAESRANLETIAATPSSALGSTRDKPDLAYCRNIFACRAASMSANGDVNLLVFGGLGTVRTARSSLIRWKASFYLEDRPSRLDVIIGLFVEMISKTRPAQPIGESILHSY